MVCVCVCVCTQDTRGCSDLTGADGLIMWQCTGGAGRQGTACYGHEHTGETHTHTHAHTYMHAHKEREREREHSYAAAQVAITCREDDMSLDERYADWGTHTHTHTHRRHPRTCSRQHASATLGGKGMCMGRVACGLVRRRTTLSLRTSARLSDGTWPTLFMRPLTRLSGWEAAVYAALWASCFERCSERVV